MSYSTTAVIKDYTDRNGKNAIVIRLTINRKIRYYPTGLKIESKHWNNGKVLGRTDIALNMNVVISRKIYEIETAIMELQTKGIPITHEIVKKNIYTDKEENDSNDFILFCQESLVNFDVGKNTRFQYNTFIKALKEFQSMISFSDINLDFVERFNQFLKGRGYKQNTIHNYHKHMKRFINRAVNLDILKKSPYRDFHVKTEETVRIYLSVKEIERIEDLKNNKHIPPHLLKLSKIFLFSCYTGLRYSDVKKLKWKDIGEDKLYLKTEKSSKVISIPLTNKAKEHIPERQRAEERVFDIVSNQKANTHLKLIAMYAQIDKTITYHTSRHTFATISLSLGIPLKIIQSILGHSSIKTTEIYAKIIDEWKDKEMAKWDN